LLPIAFFIYLPSEKLKFIACKCWPGWGNFNYQRQPADFNRWRTWKPDFSLFRRKSAFWGMVRSL